MKKLRRLDSRIDINQEFYGEQEGRSRTCNITRLESRKNLNHFRAKPSGLIGKICATFHKSHHKNRIDLDPGSNKKNGDSESRLRSLKKAKGDDKTKLTSTTKDRFFANDSLQILRCQDANKRFLRSARDSLASSPRSPNRKSAKKTHERPESCVKRKKRTLCQSTGCKNAKSKVEVREAATDVNVDLEELIVKIKELKKNVQALENAKRNAPSLKKKVAGEHVSCQTDERFVTDVYGAQELLGSCSNNFSRIRKFLGSRKCQKLIEQHRRKHCCEEKTAHLHSLLDGFEVMVKFPNEKIVHEKVHVPADSIAAKHVEDPLPEKCGDEKLHERKINEPNKVDEPKKNQDSACSTVCTTSPTSPVKDKSAGTDFPKLAPKNNGELIKKSDSPRTEKKRIEIKTGNPSKTTQSREAWYGKSTLTSENEPLETFVSENAPRIQTAVKRREMRLIPKTHWREYIMKRVLSRVPIELETDLQNEERLILIVRCLAARSTEQTRLGTKTILILRERAVSRPSLFPIEPIAPETPSVHRP